jgi:hypothetical protein
MVKDEIRERKEAETEKKKRKLPTTAEKSQS